MHKILRDKVRSAALAGCAAGLLAIAGCGAREPVDAPPALTEPGYGAAPRPDLMGAPPAAEDTPADGLLGGPPAAATAPVPVAATASDLKTWRRPDGTLVTAMAPIANPEGSRRTVRYAARAPASPPRRASVARLPVAVPVAAPVTPLAARPASRPTPIARPAPRLVAVAPAPAPLKPIAVAKPVVAPAKAPVVAPVTPVAALAAAQPAPAKPTTKLQQLQAAVAPQATRGATLATAESLTQGKAGQVTLSLPATLGDLVKQQAAKLGLTKAARKASAYADLRGPGYEITPNGRQTAVVKTGEPATFAWQVKPTAEAKGPLKTEFGLVLNGGEPAQGFTLGSIAKQVAPIRDAVKEKAKGFNLAMPPLSRYETVDVPGVGKMPSKSLLGGALVLLALLILVAISRNASAAKARAERRRKFRILTDYGGDETEFGTPKAAGVHHADHGRPEHNPFEAPVHGQGGHAPADDHRPDVRPAPKELEPTP